MLRRSGEIIQLSGFSNEQLLARFKSALSERADAAFCAGEGNEWLSDGGRALRQASSDAETLEAELLRRLNQSISRAKTS